MEGTSVQSADVLLPDSPAHSSSLPSDTVAVNIRGGDSLVSLVLEWLQQAGFSDCEEHMSQIQTLTVSSGCVFCGWFVTITYNTLFWLRYVQTVVAPVLQCFGNDSAYSKEKYTPGFTQKLFMGSKMIMTLNSIYKT